MKRLIQKGDVSVVQKMIANENLLLTDGVYDEILKNFAQNETIQRALLTRQHVPMSVLEKLLPLILTLTTAAVSRCSKSTIS